MSTNKSKRKTKYKFDKYRKYRPIDIVNLLYLIFIASFYPLFLDDKYFNITITKTNVFTYSTIAYIILGIAAIVIENSMISYYDAGKPFHIYRDSRLFAAPDLWMTLFFAANIMAWVMAENKQQAMTGSEGRRFGLAIVIVIFIMFIIMARECFISPAVLVFAFAASGLSFFIAVTQHLGYDIFGLREGVAEKQKEMFISTFGNINTFASYICIILPVFLAVFIFSEKLWARIISVIGIIAASMAIITAKSDNVYLGVAAAIVLLFYVSVWNRHIGRYFAGLFMMAAGLFSMSLLNERFHGSTAHLNGIAEMIDNKTVMGGLTAALAVFCLVFLILKKRNSALYYKIQSRQLLIIVTILGAAAIISGVVMGIRSGNEFFTFDDKWGTYRGYIWKRSWSLFLDAPPLNKIFGYGNETISQLMKANYYDEMVRITNRIYDNCHNEVLQYLVTTGIFGAVSYIGLFVTSMVYMIKRAGKNPAVIACMAGCAAYAVQGLVNLNQPITTPYYFVMLAAGIGAIRYRDQGYGADTNKK